MPKDPQPRLPDSDDTLVRHKDDLSNADLTDERLTDVRFDNCDLSNARLRGASLRRILVNEGRFTGISLSEAELTDSIWTGVRADLATFRLAHLLRVTFDSCDLRQADFTALRGQWIRFHDCLLTEADFSNAQLQHCEFRRCQLDGLDGIPGLRGSAMDTTEILTLSETFARTLGISRLDD
jgi:uncharacterized protein YjbI with pentapeptide repeats